MSQHGCPERLSNRSKGFQEEGGSQPTMEVLVETLTGTAFEMTVSPSDTIFAIKSKIFRVEGIPVSQQHLLYNLKELEDSRSLRELAIGDGARLRLVLGMRGGPVSTRRLPPPAPAHSEPWPDIERLLDSNRDDMEWSGSGCKVTVLVFRDGERVNMLRVKENHDGTYSPLDTNKYSTSLTQLSEAGGSEPAAGALRENAVTMGKMLDLRRRMESLTLQRAACDTTTGGKVEIQKTRSEEALPTHLRDELPPAPYAPFDSDDCFTLRHDNNYTRYSYECGFGSRYTLLPPIGAREERAAPEDTRLPPAPLLRRQSRREGEEAAILEECLGSEECVRAASPPDHGLQPVTQDYGELVGGCAWRGHSASALQLRAGACAAPRDRNTDLDAPFSSSTSDLENLKRNSRLLPGLSRARPREHLHLSDEGLHLRREPPPREPPPPPPPKERLYLRREKAKPYDSSETQERLYLRRETRERAAEPPEPQERLYLRREAPLEAGGEGRHTRIQKIMERDHPQPLTDTLHVKEKKIRVRCGWCKKRLSVATVHACRCGGAWCAAHRYAEVHGCAWDYKAHQPPQPTLHPPKLPKI